MSFYRGVVGISHPDYRPLGHVEPPKDGERSTTGDEPEPPAPRSPFFHPDPAAPAPHSPAIDASCLRSVAPLLDLPPVAARSDVPLLSLPLAVAAALRGAAPAPPGVPGPESKRGGPPHLIDKAEISQNQRTQGLDLTTPRNPLEVN